MKERVIWPLFVSKRRLQNLKSKIIGKNPLKASIEGKGSFLKADQLWCVEDIGMEAIAIMDEGKANKHEEYVIEILAQLYWCAWISKGNFPESIRRW